MKRGGVIKMFHGLGAVMFVCLGLAISSGASAKGILEVKHTADIYSEPDKTSEVVHRVEVVKGKGIIIVAEAGAERANGYYRVRVPGHMSEEGWIYKSYVRRYTSTVKHPKYVGYDRSLYRHWVKVNKGCRSVRDEVLVRSSVKSKLTFTDDDECKVDGGQWTDPYTGDKIEDPSVIDIDHMVPLKNAHNSGGWAWTPERRREYANYLENKYHLLAVSFSENRRKADKGPENYMPPRKAYHCTYVNNWVKVKQEWELEMNDGERATIAATLKSCR